MNIFTQKAFLIRFMKQDCKKHSSIPLLVCTQFVRGSHHPRPQVSCYPCHRRQRAVVELLQSSSQVRKHERILDSGCSWCSQFDQSTRMCQMHRTATVSQHSCIVHNSITTYYSQCHCMHENQWQLQKNMESFNWHLYPCVALYNVFSLICFVTLETVNMNQPLQSRQHMQTPYLGQIWHVTVGKWSTLTGLISSGSVYCFTHAGKKHQNVAILTKLSQFPGLLCPQPFTKPGQILLTYQISFTSVYCVTFQG